MRRWVAQVALIVSVVAVAGVPAVAKQNVTVEGFYSGAWNDLTADLDKQSIVINHAAGNEQTGIVPSDGTLRFKNPAGRMNPHNTRGPLFGLITEKMPMRVKVDGDIRLSGRAVSWKPRRSLGGTKYVSWVDVTIAGKVRELGQDGKPVRAPLRPSIEADGPYLYLPMEDGSSSAHFASGLSGGTPVVPAGPVSYAAIAGAAGAGGPGPSFAPGGGTPMSIPLKLAPPFALEYIVFPASDDAGQVLFGFSYLSSASAVPINIGITSPTYVDPTLVGSNGWHHVIITLRQNGADVERRAWFDGGEVPTADEIGATLGDLIRIDIGTFGADPPTQPWGIAHLAVHASATSVDPVARYEAMRAYATERAGYRFIRMCTELGIAYTIVGDPDETQPMGPQPVDTALKILDDVARTDAGFIHDTRSAEGLTFRTGRSLYNQ